jgi:hypothetical protein
MATKMKLIKMLQEFKGLAQITNRRPAPRPPLLYLMQLRTQAAQAVTPRKRLTVEIEAVHAPMAIKINHIKSDRSNMPVMIA